MKRILVTGANGFIGSRLIAELHARGTAITAASRREIKTMPGVRWVRIDDIGETTDWTDALADCGAVVHLAARVHVMHDDASQPLEEYRKVNVAGTVRLAREAQRAGVTRFVFVSTIKVNGEQSPAGRGFSEMDLPHPADAYAVSKAEAEQALLDLARSSGMEVVIIRPPLVYGPGVKANFLSMTQWLERGIPLPLGGFTENRRSLVAVDNLIDFIARCVDHPKAANEIFLVADGEDVSTVALMQRTAAALGVRARLIPVPVPVLQGIAKVLRRDRIMQRLAGTLQVDIRKARDRLGWTPPVSLDEGLRRAVQTEVKSL
jgi:nucleoside-diphosphate-sugar epimerase